MVRNPPKIKFQKIFPLIFVYFPTFLVLANAIFIAEKSAERIYILQKIIYEYYFVFVFFIIAYGVFEAFKLNKRAGVHVSLGGMMAILLYLGFAFTDYGIPPHERLSAKSHPDIFIFIIIQAAVPITLANYFALATLSASTGIRARLARLRSGSRIRKN